MKAAVSGAWTGWRAPVAAMLVMLALALPGFFTLPPVDRDEARFARASAQMIETGDLIDIRLGDEPRYKKPVGIYWLQAAVAGLTAPDRTSVSTISSACSPVSGCEIRSSSRFTPSFLA